MPTLVALHAHPDDEAIFTGGVLRAATAGWRVVVVFATSGEEGDMPAWVGTDTAAHRESEARAAGVALGAGRVAFLGFRDSGPRQRARFRPGSLAAAPVQDVVDALDAVLGGERPDVVTTYDANGTYGHPDHLAVHRAGCALDVPVYEATVSRSHLDAVRGRLVARRALVPSRWPVDLVGRLGTGDEDLLEADVTAELPAKLEALAAHRSQVPMAPDFMGIPAGAFHHTLDREWYRLGRPGARSPDFEVMVAGRPAAALVA